MPSDSSIKNVPIEQTIDNDLENESNHSISEKSVDDNQNEM